MEHSLKPGTLVEVNCMMDRYDLDVPLGLCCVSCPPQMSCCILKCRIELYLVVDFCSTLPDSLAK
jgi:hypothetical protein